MVLQDNFFLVINDLKHPNPKNFHLHIIENEEI